MPIHSHVATFDTAVEAAPAGECAPMPPATPAVHNPAGTARQLRTSVATSPEPGPPPASEPAPASLQTSPILEPESAASPWFDQSPTAEKLFEDCVALTRAGEPCLAPPQAGSAFCIFHDPAYRETQRANSASGGRASGEARRGHADAIHPLVLADPSERRYLLGLLLEGQLTGRMSASRARGALATIQALERLERR